MRLFQLARKLGTTPDHLITILAEHDHRVENKSNTKLTEEHEAILTDHLTVQQKDEKTELVESTEEEIPLIESIPANIEEIANEEPQNVEIVEEAMPDPPVVDEIKEAIEVIRVKKVKLDGPKVVGKIDLPEVPVKAKPEPKEKEDRPKRKERYSRRKSSRKEPTPEQLRQREKREKERKRKEEENKKKKNRARFYKENVQPKPDIVSKPKKKKVAVQNYDSTPPKKDTKKHSNPVKRLWAWLNGEYDKY